MMQFFLKGNTEEYFSFLSSTSPVSSFVFYFLCDPSNPVWIFANRAHVSKCLEKLSIFLWSGKSLLASGHMFHSDRHKLAYSEREEIVALGSHTHVHC